METLNQNRRVPRFYATYCSVSSTLNCVLEFNRFKKAINITVEPQWIDVSIGQTRRRLTLTDVVLQPETCRGLKWSHAKELQFSIKGNARNSDKSDITRQRKFSHQSELVEQIQKLQGKWYCGSCKEKILADWSIFNRVLPLPSENWSDFAGMWFCHNHDDKDGFTEKQQRLLPKTRECFVGETFVLVDKQHVNDSVVEVSKNGAIVCRRCSIQLGVADTGNHTDSVYKFFQHAILIKDLEFEDLIQSESTVCSSERLDNFFSQLLQEQSESYASYRFLIESKPLSGSGGVSTCLLWLMDSNIEMYSRDLDSDVSASGCRVCKVLFKCQLTNENEARTPDYVTKSVISLWRKDNTVHGFTLPHPLFLQLIYRLIENCKLLPTSQRYLNGFHVSFIQTSMDS